MTSGTIERRVAPRFAVVCTGELAYGSTVASVQISDMSVTGCGIDLKALPADANDSVGHAAVLNVRPSGASAPPVMLPVVINNCRAGGNGLRLGLQFRRLSMPQMRNLIGILEQVVTDPS